MPGYTSYGFPGPRRLVRAPSAKSLAIRLADQPASTAFTS